MSACRVFFGGLCLSGAWLHDFFEIRGHPDEHPLMEALDLKLFTFSSSDSLFGLGPLRHHSSQGFGAQPLAFCLFVCLFVLFLFLFETHRSFGTFAAGGCPCTRRWHRTPLDRASCGVFCEAPHGQ